MIEIAVVILILCLYFRWESKNYKLAKLLREAPAFRDRWHYRSWLSTLTKNERNIVIDNEHLFL
jgi:hypothetical protein